jgi:hypothetical protein
LNWLAVDRPRNTMSLLSFFKVRALFGKNSGLKLAVLREWFGLKTMKFGAVADVYQRAIFDSPNICGGCFAPANTCQLIALVPGKSTGSI